MEADKPVFLDELMNECRRIGMDALALELRTHIDMDSAILLIHDRLLAAGKNVGAVFRGMGFILEDRGAYGKQGAEFLANDVGGAQLSCRLEGKISPSSIAMLHYLQDPESAVRLVERELGEEAPSVLRDYLIETGLYPVTTKVDDLVSPIEVQKSWQKLKLSRVADKMLARWQETKFKKQRSIYEEALRQEVKGDPTPLQVAALFTNFVAGDCAEIAGKTTYQEAIGAALQMFYLTGLKVSLSANLLSEAGLYPVPKEALAQERGLRERVGKDLFDRFQNEEMLRHSLAQEYSFTLSLQELAALRRSSHQTGYDLPPEAAVSNALSCWLKARFTH